MRQPLPLRKLFIHDTAQQLLCKQSYQTTAVNNNLSWAGFYGSEGRVGNGELVLVLVLVYSADNLQLVLCLVITAHSKQARDGSELGAGVGNILILNGE